MLDVKEQGFNKARMIVPFFYYILLFFSFQQLEGLKFQVTHPRPLSQMPWPLFWAKNLDFSVLITIVMLVFLLTSVIGAFFFFNRIARVAAFVGMLLFHAYMNASGPNHQFDVWLWTSFLLILLPGGWSLGRHVYDELFRKKFLMVFWGVQAYILLIYTLSGIGKLIGSIEQWKAGGSTLFSPDSAVLTVASQLLQMQQNSVLGTFIMAHSFLSWLGFLSIFYIQIVALCIAFRPVLHRAWALFLILFHLATYLAMNAIFVAPIPLLALFFFDSPFAKNNESLRMKLKFVPIFGNAILYAQNSVKK